MSRRPLGASLPIDQRLVAYEAWIREVQAAIDRLAEAVEALETGALDGRRVTAAVAAHMHHEAFVELQEIRGRGFRAPRR